MEERAKSLADIRLEKEDILSDYYTAVLSRQMSLLGRKEVFAGKAKFGIFGDGKEVPQLAMARVFKKGDWRSGYYRDQTFMLAAGLMSPEHFYAQLYAHANDKADPMSGGRQMSSHFGTRFLNKKGEWLKQTELKNVVADISPTGSQMPRLTGLGLASKLYRNSPELKGMDTYSNNGQEIAFGTIGNASTAEGMFWETINATAILQIPVLISIWDDGYGISVPNHYQVAKNDISEVLEGFMRTGQADGFEIMKVKGWDYASLLDAYRRAEFLCRDEHVPVIIHVTDLTQPQGHSTSGSHERYKSAERLQWEKDYDCIVQMKNWIEFEGIASREEVEQIEQDAIQHAKEARKNAWKAFQTEMKTDFNKVKELLDEALNQNPHQGQDIQDIRNEMESVSYPLRADAFSAARRAYWLLRNDDIPAKEKLKNWIEGERENNEERYNTRVYIERGNSALHVEGVEAEYSNDPPQVDGRMVLNTYFKNLFSRDPRVVAFGEDVGAIGDVNKAFDGLQAQFGEHRIWDTGIREVTILGQGIGMAMRGLKPILEIQYLDYVFYALQLMSDDLACLHYRSNGGQAAPLIVRTRGHRLEGIWHAGSPLGTLINSLRGMHICVPRNMTQAAGFYNTLLQGDDPGLVIESLNGYRLKENLPENLDEFCVPLGVPEVIRHGDDVTIVTYGSMVRICEEAANWLAKLNISAEVIDVQTLLPFDRFGTITESLKKTNKLLIADEDMPGAATGYMMQQILETNGGMRHLDAEVKTLPARPHRPAYASDGDYFSKPNVEDVVEVAYGIMQEYDPQKYPYVYSYPLDLKR